MRLWPACRDVARTLSDGQERPLEPGERVAVRMHLLFCDGCRQFRRQLDLMRDAVRRLPHD